ncbi:MAG TPA: thioredoxin family protein [Candidatus Saccharimonadia bacterium]|nr:thioredoxin family protein [Candidatus Saccharimonadia bacterium]
MNWRFLFFAALAIALAAYIWSSSSKPTSGSSDNAETVSHAISSGQPVLLEFYADWCGPCHTVAPSVAELTSEVEGRAQVIRINVDEHRELAANYSVRNIPLFVVLKSGRESSREAGVISKETMLKMLGL